MEGGGMTAVDEEELDTADLPESLALPAGASITNSRE
jgi:hypothetical protein